MSRGWLTVVGIGDDGIDSLSAAARALVDGAELLVGGARHHAMVPQTAAVRLTWAEGLERAMDVIESWRGRRVVVLATGDPLFYGAGANLLRRFTPDDMMVLPVPGAFSLAAARMVWPLSDVEMLTVHGGSRDRAVESLALSLAPGARWLVLSRDGRTPAAVAALLTAHGYGPSAITVLEHLGGTNERRLDGVAETWSHPAAADLNTLAIECRAGPAARILSRAPGLADEACESDGQITKREVRAVTLAALAPLPGQVLWDVGAGSGSIAIEWLRAAPRRRPAGRGEAQAVAIERDADRCAMIARNAAALGVPQLRIVGAEAPGALAGLEPAPDTVFIGGGIAQPEMLDAGWSALPSGGRLVANAVTLEGEARLIDFYGAHGGGLIRIAVSRAEPVGRLSAFKPAMDVIQYVGVKP
ncbi:MAG TPA: precorrin-6y C5,15-methyltransferase (decarboxylating) subunit CbiE [Rhodospirillales bacterium]|nr:precorrin-6y C5,15-methyltransferase (decarboxylating) subunit CbiE [Rhodospirillales bacterium]